MSDKERMLVDEETFVRECGGALNQAFIDYISSREGVTAVTLNTHVSMLVEVVYFHLTMLEANARSEDGSHSDLNIDKLVINMVGALITCHGHRSSGECVRDDCENHHD